MIIMNCNYYADNSQRIKEAKEDILLSAMTDINSILPCSCHTGVQEYEPKHDEKESYCFSDFRNCPRFLTRIK
jgi:hypothetical protein